MSPARIALPRSVLYLWSMLTLALALALVVALALSVSRERAWRTQFKQSQIIAAEEQRRSDTWVAGASTRLPDGTLRLRTGDCLTPARFPKPWASATPWASLGSVPSPTGIEVSAPASVVGIQPYERAGFDTSFEGRPHDRQLHVLVHGWSYPANAAASWRIGSPPKLEENLRTGLLKRRSLWVDPGGWEAFTMGGRLSGYADQRRISQCRDHEAAILCSVISPDQELRYFVELDAAERSRLPQTLGKITAAIEAAREPCMVAVTGS